MASKSRKRHATITDTDSDESLTASQSKSSVSKQPYVPILIIIHSEVEGKDISLLSPFLIEKAIMSIAGEPKSIKNLRSGDLLIQCTKQPHEANLLKMKTFCRLKCTVTPHKSLNTSKGVVRCSALRKQSCEHILEFMGEQGVTDVRRINVHCDGELKPTNTFVFTFDSPALPAIVRIGFDKRDDFDFEIVNFPFLDGDVPRSTSYGVYISQLIRFARASSYVADFNIRNKLLTQKFLKQGYRYHKLRKTFSKNL